MTMRHEEAFPPRRFVELVCRHLQGHVQTNRALQALQLTLAYCLDGQSHFSIEKVCHLLKRPLELMLLQLH